MTSENITIKILTAAETNISSVVEIYKDAGWWKDNYSPAFIQPMIEKSCCFAGAFDGDRMIGMGRAISDNISDAYIQDIAVLKEYRGCGIGSKIVEKIIEELKSRDVDWIALIGEPGTESFYKRLGFSVMNGYIPMIYQ